MQFLGFEAFQEVFLSGEDRYAFWFPQILPVSTANFVKQNRRPLEECYVMGKKLGEGSFGTVYEVDHKAFESTLSLDSPETEPEIT